MTPIADMVAQMLAASSPAEAIVAAVRAMESVTTPSRRERDASRSVTIPNQSKEAVRAARYRAKRKQNQSKAEANDAAKTDFQQRDADRDASRRSVTAHCDLSSASSLFPEVVTEEGSKSRKQDSSEKARARGSRMIAGAVISDDDFQFALDHGAEPAAIRQAWAEFVDYWIAVPGQRGTKLDWAATWRNRVRDVFTKGRKNGQARATGSSLSERAFALAEQARSAEREAGIDRPDDPFRKH